MSTPWLYRPPVTTYASAETWIPQSRPSLAPQESERPPSASPCVIQQLRQLQLQANLQNAQALSPKRPRPPDLNRGESTSLSHWGGVTDAWLQEQAAEAARRLAVESQHGPDAGLIAPVKAERTSEQLSSQHLRMPEPQVLGLGPQDPASPFGFSVPSTGCKWDAATQQQHNWLPEQGLGLTEQGQHSQHLYIPIEGQAGTSAMMLSPFSAAAGTDPLAVGTELSSALPPAINVSVARRSTGGYGMAHHGPQQEQQHQNNPEGGRPFHQVRTITAVVSTADSQIIACRICRGAYTCMRQMLMYRYVFSSC